jgi:hypothetical protein
MEFEGDAFISYAHLDNLELVEGRKGWVANFHRALEVRVAQLLGKSPHIWRDPKLSGNDLFAETLIDRLRRVAVLVTVVTPRYIRSEWTLRELKEFFRAAEEQGGLKVRDKARVFKVLKQPVPLERVPDELKALLGYEFFKVEPDTGKVRELDEVFGPEAQRDFWLRLDDLAHDLVALLEALESDAQLSPFVPDVPPAARVTSAGASGNGGAAGNGSESENGGGPPTGQELPVPAAVVAPAAPVVAPATPAAGAAAAPLSSLSAAATSAPPIASASAAKATVFLAETTSDVREQRESLRRDLQQHGYRVLPERPVPHEADEARALIQQDLAQSRLSIHMLGKNYGLVPEGATASIAEMQYELAAERSQQGRFSRLVWIAPGLQVDDARQRTLLERVRLDPGIRDHADLLETPFEDLRTTVQDWLTRDLAPAATAPTQPGAAPQLYLIADQRDLDRIAPWSDTLFDQHLEVIQPIYDGDESDIRAFHEETLSTCDGCLILYGSGNELWLRRKLREIQKSPGYGRTKPLPPVWIAQIAPRTPEKERFRTHEATVVAQWDGVDLEGLRPLVAQLKAGHPA